MATKSVSYTYGTIDFLPENESSYTPPIIIEDFFEISNQSKVAFAELAEIDSPFIILGGNNRETVGLFYAAAEYNCTVILLAQTKKYLLNHIMKQTGVNIVVSSDENFKLRIEKFEKKSDWKSNWLEDGKYAKGHIGILTSGTTSLPKVCLRTWDYITSGQFIEQIVKENVMNRFILLSSITHIYAMSITFMAKVGAERGFNMQLCLCSNASQVTELIIRKNNQNTQGYSNLFGTPSFFNHLVTHLDQQELDIQKALSGGCTLTPEVYKQMFDKFGIRLSQGYGSTEVGTVSIYDETNTDEGEFSITKVPKGVELEIMSATNGAVLRDGEQGSIFVHTETMSIGYIQNGRLIPHPYFYQMGDGGRIDTQKYAATGELGLKIGERLRNPIKRRVEGLDISIQGFQVELRLLEHPMIANALVILKDSNLLARVVLKKDAEVSVEDIWEWCTLNLPKFVKFDKIEIVEYLLCDGVGKLTLH